MTKRSQEVDGLVEKAILYIERHPHVSATDLMDAGYHPAVDRVKGNVNSLRKKAGVPLRGKGQLYSEDWEKLERRFRRYLKKNPEATEPDIRAAGYGGVFRHRFDSDIERAKAGQQAPETIVYTDGGIEYNPSKPDAIIGQSQKFRKAMELATRVSSENIDALVVGENGTGKDLIVKYIHNEGVRAERPFIVYKCYRTSVDRNHVIGELFGFRVGAGASRKGIIELAYGGDLVLDCLQDLSDFGQLAFEDFVSDRIISVLGKNGRKIDVRFLSVADSSIKGKVRKGEFKNGLYYKLGKVVIDVPPLRERADDIGLLASYFLDKHSKLQGKKKPKLSTAEVAELMTRVWEGNVRELENYMETSVLSGEIAIPQADYSVSDKKSGGNVAIPSVSEGKLADLFKDVNRIKDAERILIEKAIEKARGNKILAARILGIGKSSLYRKLEQYKAEG